MLGEELSQQTPVKTLNKTNTCMSKKSTFKFEALNEAGKPKKAKMTQAQIQSNPRNPLPTTARNDLEISKSRMSSPEDIRLHILNNEIDERYKPVVMSELMSKYYEGLPDQNWPRSQRHAYVY